ncbi:MAG: serine hydrolase [Eubacteriales bacterium]|jgi:beta-lactamase class A|nr:serine hydrolase [Eubacteriales bacterium]
MRRKKLFPLLISVIAVLVIAIIIITFSYIADIKKNEGDVAVFASQKDSAEDNIIRLNERISALESEKIQLNEQLDALGRQLMRLKEEKDALLNTHDDADSRFRELNKKFEALNAEIAIRDSAIAQLQENISKLETNYTVDINAQFDILNEISEKLANPLMIEIKNTVKNEDGTTTEIITYETPKIAIYYEDITNGYKYAYNADEVLDPASMVKAPFILSLLAEASAEEERISEARLAAEANGTLDTFTEPERVYDMTKKIVYTKEEYYKSGSGEISGSEDGTEYTYRDLFYHVLECSDNVAYAVLKDTYGTTHYGSLVVSLGATSMYKKPTGMSAADAGKCMKAIYEFMENDVHYGMFMKDALTGSAHHTIIPYSVTPKQTAHKYGWDKGAYNDMAVVYAENPYVLAILTDYDKGGKEVNEYIQSVLKLIDQMHDNFYKQR